MGVEKERGLKSALETVAVAGITVGAVGLGASYVDAQLYSDLLSGASPLVSDEGAVSFKHVLRGLRDLPSEEIAPENFTVQQSISSWGTGLTFLSVLFSGRPMKSVQVGGSWTLATLAANEASKLLADAPLDNLSSLALYGGAASTMYAAGLIALLKEPKNLIEQGKEAIEKARAITSKFRK